MLFSRPQPNALTITSKNGLQRVLVSPCEVSEAFDPRVGDPATHPTLIEFAAIWDTGATGSVITQRVVDSCGLKPTGVAQVNGVHGAATVETFLVNIRLPNGVGFSAVAVTKGELGPGAHVLIGMDIITMGDFAVTNHNGLTVMSFRCPSHKCIDFVKEASAQQIRVQPSRGVIPPGKKGRRR